MNTALQDGARLQALEASHMYYALLKWHTKKVTPVLHQERLEEVKDKVEMTGLRPTNEKQPKGIKAKRNIERPHFRFGEEELERGAFHGRQKEVN